MKMKVVQLYLVLLVCSIEVDGWWIDRSVSGDGRSTDRGRSSAVSEKIRINRARIRNFSLCIVYYMKHRPTVF